jgi:hypothetical protein
MPESAQAAASASFLVAEGSDQRRDVVAADHGAENLHGLWLRHQGGLDRAPMILAEEISLDLAQQDRRPGKCAP